MSSEPLSPEQSAAPTEGAAAHVPPSASASTPSSAAVDGSDELAVLDQLEADLSAVEQAISTLDQISSDGVGGEQAAAEIAAAVSTERFGDAPADTPGTTQPV